MQIRFITRMYWQLTYEYENIVKLMQMMCFEITKEKKKQASQPVSLQVYHKKIS